MNPRALTRACGLGFAATLVFSLISPANAEPAPAPTATDHIVVLTEPAVARYTGGVPGIPATQPREGERLQSASTANVRAYSRHLAGVQDEVIADHGITGVTYRYDTVLNGFTAPLTEQQVAELKADRKVLTVAKERSYQLDTNKSPDFLGLTGKKGVWNYVPGKLQGQGVIVGVVDSGIRYDNPSFAAGTMPAPPARWKGSCETGDPAVFPADACQNKLIGAKYFWAAGEDNLPKGETMTPMDYDGHGTHTASTAAGNNGVTATLGGKDMGTISGMAPQAHVAAYKACFGPNCAGKDLLAAINAAVKDGVDIINYSISGTRTDFLDPFEIAFLNAAAAGVFVAASAGNSGPADRTVAHPSPWVTTVAAAHHKNLDGTLVTGDGTKYFGPALMAPLQKTPMVYAGDIALPGVDNADLCFENTLDPAKAKDKFVVCDRGVIARVDKSAEVKRAGGAGMVLVNVTPGGLNADTHSVPSIHLPDSDRESLLAYVRGTANPIGEILASNEGSPTVTPRPSEFSSRGPSLAGAGNEGAVLKPDIIAPGSDVLAAYSSPDLQTNYGMISGTSMSSPHIAGLAALIKQRNPGLSPMGIKSSMMTTADPIKGEQGASPFTVGAGMVDPQQFLFPGLVYDSGVADWFAFLEGQTDVDLDGVEPIKPWNLNQPSIAVNALLGTVKVTRTVTNVNSYPMVWTASHKGLDGVDVTISPKRLFIAPGKSATYTVSFANRTAASNEWATGSITWTDMSHRTVTSPVAVLPQGATSPKNVTLPSDATTVEIPVTSGINGTITATVQGLTKGDVTEGEVTPPPDRTGFQPEHEGNVRADIVVPAGSARQVRVQNVNAAGHEADDIDLFITKKGDTAPVARQATVAADEDLTVTLAPGEYTLHAQTYETDKNTPLALRVFVLGTADNGNLVFNPASKDVEVLQEVTFTGTLTLEGSPWAGNVVFVDAKGKQLSTTAIVVG